MNAGSAPSRIVLGKPSDEFHHLLSSLCTHASMIASGKNTPIESESSSVPSHNRFRIDNPESGFPLTP